MRFTPCVIVLTFVQMEPRIPKNIWHTYKSFEQLPTRSLPCINSWVSLNPGWGQQFYSDADILEFFQNFFAPEITDLLHSLPLGVMKADLWRYAMLWEFGGIYTDIDTVCVEPLDTWLDATNGKGLQVACESGHPYFCQWTIVAAPRHPALKHAIDLIGERVAATGGVDESMPHYVHHYTGPDLWTAAIQRYLGSDEEPPVLCEDRSLWEDRDIEIHPGQFFDGLKSRHLNASSNWRSPADDYASWQEQRKDIDRMKPITSWATSLPGSGDPRQIRTFVISLRRSRVRRLNALRQLVGCPISFEVVDGMDAALTKPELLQGGAGSSLSPTEVACYLSHLSVLERVIDYDLDFAIILEDDFSLENGKTLTLENILAYLPEDADHVQLHDFGKFICSEYTVEKAGRFFNRLVCTNLTSVGYLVSQRFARFVVEKFSEPMMPIDHLYLEISKSGNSFGFYDLNERLVDARWDLPTLIHI